MSSVPLGDEVEEALDAPHAITARSVNRIERANNLTSNEYLPATGQLIYHITSTTTST